MWFQCWLRLVLFWWRRGSKHVILVDIKCLFLGYRSLFEVVVSAHTVLFVVKVVANIPIAEAVDGTLFWSHPLSSQATFYIYRQNGSYNRNRIFITAPMLSSGEAEQLR